MTTTTTMRPEVLFGIDLDKPMSQQQLVGHNRWHPDIPAIASVKPGTIFRMECKDWTDGQIKNNDSANDVRDIDLSVPHVLSGPVAVEGAEPGDVLVVDILDVAPFPGKATSWGFTGIFSHDNGGGFLTDHFPDAHKAIWDLNGVVATSRHVPDVRFVGIPHPGLIGCAPSHDLLNAWNRREADLIATDPNRVPPLALPPEEKNAVMGSLKGSDMQNAAREAARTVPPREHGGNCDIKNLTRGSRVYFPVYIKGANLSLGDLHFSQGDGEITFCGAIEMAGYIDLQVDLIKGGVNTYGMLSPIFRSSPLEPRYSNFLVFEGISVDEAGKQYYMDAHIAYRNACLSAISYLEKCGYTGEQAYIILGAAPIEGRVSGIVDIPNACCSLYLPTEIFERDVEPMKHSVSQKRQVAVTS
ncbi:formamidase [Dictyobacter sp. S3.2.2.5]|uniref:Formamidase n=1 Tax=Dictyobacter halimunensis TaxID=3026934 RepID=A0ABQ6FL36_9CHLR|nr:formamidase [Dictyobacter sp. S3.2.2.5]